MSEYHENIEREYESAWRNRREKEDEGKKICYKCIHFNSWEGNTWCFVEEELSWNNAPYCKEYKEEG